MSGDLRTANPTENRSEAEESRAGCPFSGVQVPERLARRPRDARGYPVLFTSHVREDGTPDFRVSDPDRVLEAAQRRLCGVCGERLGYWIVFLSGPQGCANRCFADPPMHPECAEFSVAVCPYLATRAERSAAMQREHGAGFQAMDPTAVRDKPTKLGLFTTRDYTTIPNGDFFLFRAATAKSIEWRELATKEPR